MKLLTAPALLLSLFLLLPAQGHAFRRLAEGQALPDFTAETLEGKPFRLRENLGNSATLLVFWAAWSPRSAEALRDAGKLHGELRDAGLHAVAVNGEHQEWDPADAELVRQALSDAGVAFPAVLDKNLAVFDLYGVSAVPSLALADGTGRVLKLLPGYPGTLRDEFAEAVRAALGRGEKQTAPPAPAAYAPKGKSEKLYRMADLFRKKGFREKSVSLLREALAEDPDHPEARRLLTELLEKTGETSNASKPLPASSGR